MLLNVFTDLELRVRSFARNLCTRDQGASAVEYGLLIALVASVIILAVTLLGTNLNNRYSDMATRI